MAVTSREPAAADLDRYGPGPGDGAWREVDWAAHQHWVEVAGRPVNYVELGEGPPLLLVHGLAGSWQNWLETIPSFARTRRVVALDLPGFGESPMPAEKISMRGYGQLVDAFCDAIGLERGPLVGNSMGGYIGAEVAIAHPHRVDKLVLVSAAGITAEHQRNERVLALMRRFEAALAWAATHPTPRFFMRRRARRGLRLVFAHPDKLPGALLYEQAKGSGKPGFIDALDAISDYPLRDRLERISVPTLVVWGDRDKLVPLRDADVFEELIPDARKVVYADTGHVPMLERPSRFNRDVEAFL
ncbi:MAG TPA: alpha/beta fold hydrolase [Solirubrobacteraceae bacterium]|jgi:pimeloyl-ACP methyl ester carboxylesterase|nr:alpha/beta fold hydrolase [Solirubrobacteraceae bacterium]